jgi:hypothetical protein
MKDHPLGVGPRNFHLIAGRYGLSEGAGAQNLFLQAGADHGLLGAAGLALCYRGALGQTLWSGRGPAARPRGAERSGGWAFGFSRWLALGLAAFIACAAAVGAEGVDAGCVLATVGLCTVCCLKRAEAMQPAAVAGAPVAENGAAGVGGAAR